MLLQLKDDHDGTFLQTTCSVQFREHTTDDYGPLAHA